MSEFGDGPRSNDWYTPKWVFDALGCEFERPDGSLGEQPGNGTTLMALGERAVSAMKTGQASGLGVILATNLGNRSAA